MLDSDIPQSGFTYFSFAQPIPLTTGLFPFTLSVCFLALSDRWGD